MATPRFAALALLVLFVGPALVAARSLTAAASSGTKNALESMQEDCLSTAEIAAVAPTGFYGLDNEDCKACMDTMDKLNMDVWPCREGVCQNPKFFAPEYPANPDAAADDAAALFSCPSCVDDGVFNCADCVAYNDPDVCQLCGATVVTDWKNWCLQCLWSPTARPKPAGTLEYADWAAMDAKGESRSTDYGACAFQANQSYYIEAGLINPVGIRGTCAWKVPDFQPPVLLRSTPAPNPFFVNNVGNVITPSPDFGISKCIECMDATYKYKGLGGTQPENTTKVGSYNWACTECAGITDPVIRQLCIECIKTPAKDAGYVESPTATEAAAYAFKLDSTEWVGNASEIVGSCVDMAKASTWVGNLADWYTSACPNCTAQQRSCYKIRNVSYTAEQLKLNAGPPLEGNTLTTFKQHLDLSLADADDFKAAVSAAAGAGFTTADACATCMMEFSAAAQAGSMYACEQYCMNPDTITSLKQQTQCFDCLTDFREADVANVAPCGLCMTAVADVWGTEDNVTAKRKECITCIKGDNKDPNKDWACVECAKLTSTTANDECFKCISAGVLDPCACVDGVKRGWLFFTAAGGCLDKGTIDTALGAGTLKGSMTTGSLEPEQCAKIADGLGHPTFGLDNDRNCYTFPANIQYISKVPGVTTTCTEVNPTCLCPSTTSTSDAPVASVSAVLDMSGKTVGQSTTYREYPYNNPDFPNGLAAALAIDASANTDDVNSCSHTLSNPVDTAPFWWVNLHDEDYVVSKVEITGRSGSTCGASGSVAEQACLDRLKGIKIYLGPTAPSTVDADISTLSNTFLIATDTTAWTANLQRAYEITSTGIPIAGRYLSIQTTGGAPLTLCDVKV
ncbi:hypothetical protein FOA52_004874 [Chlamydomonas sp. UWO 241]|nr:hypothetical protein FOA52_004874 [Chlamydomonas sp. UWO 241]